MEETLQEIDKTAKEIHQEINKVKKIQQQADELTKNIHEMSLG